MSTTSSPGSVDENARRQFEDAWRQGRPQPIEHFLPPRDNSSYLATLEELVHIELEFQWKSRRALSTCANASDRTPCVEDYLARFVELRDRSIVVRLLQQEYRVRHRYGDRPSVREYCTRFPEIVSTGAEIEGSLGAVTAPGAAGLADSPEIPGYEVIGLLGQGGMGVVHRGRDPELGREIAVKILLAEHQGDPEFLRRFLDEARIHGQLQHPGVVPVHELGRLPDGRPFFTMKLVQGQTLADLLKQRHNPTDDLPRFLTIFEQVCQALAHAHEQGVIHRDLKPSNIMVGGFGEVQVMDWGLAKSLHQARTAKPSRETTSSAHPVLTADWDSVTVRAPQPPDGDTLNRVASRAGQAIGTPGFMSPEQARGEITSIDERADVFGLGGILCVILTGQPPCSAHNLAEMYDFAIRGSVGEAFARLDTCGADSELVLLCRDCLAPDPGDRPRDARVVVRRVTAYQASVQNRLHQAELGQAAAHAKAAEEHKRRRLTVVLAGAVLALVTLAAGVGVWFVQQRAELRRGTESALVTSAALRDAARWKEALDVLAHEESRQSWAGSEELRQQLARAQADVRLTKRLDEIRQKRATLIDGKFDDQAADHEYLDAFTSAGLWQEGETEDVAAARIRASAISGQLQAALDDWANAQVGWPRRKWLLGVAGRIGSDTWGLRFRDPNIWDDRNALRELAEEANMAQLSPQLLTTVGLLIRSMKMDAVPWLTAAQGQYPNDFWLNYYLGIALRAAKEPGKAVGFFRAALAIRPDSVAAHITLGNALKDLHQVDEAIRSYRRAIELDDHVALAHDNLGLALMDKKQVDEAIAAHKRAIEIDPNFPPAHGNLAVALDASGQKNEALTAYRKAIELNPRDLTTHNNLGMFLLARGDWSEASKEFSKAIEVDAGVATIHVNLGIALRQQNQRPKAIAEFRQAIDLDSKDTRALFSLGSALLDEGSFVEAQEFLRRCRDSLPETSLLHKESIRLLRRCDYLIILDERLGTVLDGEAKPADAAENLALAGLCREYKGLFAASADFYTAAFASRPELATDLGTGHRASAARAAALAGSGQGKDGARLDNPDRARMRQKALDWLRADLEAWIKRVRLAPPDERALATNVLKQWRSAAEFEGVRGVDSLAKLSEAEGDAWRKFWYDVEALLGELEDHK
jgi:serine/threonine-protein kinase